MTTRILVGDALTMLATLPERSVHCCVCSPPYLNLRRYDTVPVQWPAVTYSPMPGLPPIVEVPAITCELGQESTPEAYIGHLVLVFREVRRVMDDSATCWINIGDSYARNPKKGGSGTPNGRNNRGESYPDRSDAGSVSSLAEKNLIGIPWRLAFALQADGFWLRSDIIWSKKNPMPSSVEDRCSGSHEYIFMLAKAERYFFDATAIAEPTGEYSYEDVHQVPNGQRRNGISQSQEGEGWTSRAVQGVRSGIHESNGENTGEDSEQAFGATALQGQRAWFGEKDTVQQIAGGGSSPRTMEAVTSRAGIHEGIFSEVSQIGQSQGSVAEVLPSMPTESDDRSLPTDGEWERKLASWDPQATVGAGSDALRSDSRSMASDQGCPRGPLRDLLGNSISDSRSHNSTEQRRTAHSGKYSSALPELQQSKRQSLNTRNKRSVWEMSAQPFPESHYAVFPSSLPTTCIKAGTSERGHCPECGKRWVRVVNRESLARNELPVEHKDYRPGYYTRKAGGNEGYANGGGQRLSFSTTIGWQPSCTCGAPADMRPNDLDIIETPTGARAEDDPTLLVGRAGMSRPRGEEEGSRPITRYEQRQYAAQLKASPNRGEMEAEAGLAFAHYTRTDKGGARPVPPTLLSSWIERGWLVRVLVPAWKPLEPIPDVVLDPFGGSGTTSLAAERLQRDSIIVEINPSYTAMAEKRIHNDAPLFTEIAA